MWTKKEIRVTFFEARYLTRSQNASISVRKMKDQISSVLNYLWRRKTAIHKYAIRAGLRFTQAKGIIYLEQVYWAIDNSL